MMRILNSVSIACFVVVILSGCVGEKPRQINEVLQLPKAGRVYTAHNIWYEDPTKISSINYQKGNILPYGTEVDGIEIEDEEIRFRDATTGKRYRIEFKKYWEMIPVEDYIRQIFTRFPPENTLSSSSSYVRKAINSGKVRRGMTRDDVIKCYGHPSAHRTPLESEDTWIFWKAPGKTIRVIFKDDKVDTILE